MSGKIESLAASLEADRLALRQLQNRIAAKAARLQVASRALDTRRKILLGAWILDGLQKNPAAPPWNAVADRFDDFRAFLGEKNAGLFPDDFPGPLTPPTEPPAS